MELNKTANTNDVLRGAASIAYGGTLNLTNLAGALAASDSFTLFSAATYSGAFTKLIPPMAGSGLAWDTKSLITNGTLRVAVAPKPVINSLALAGGNLVSSATNGVPNANCYVLTATNLTLPLTQWARVATNVFDNVGNLVWTNPVNPASPQQFFLLQLP
jgi:hypothetical protein